MKNIIIEEKLSVELEQLKSLMTSQDRISLEELYLTKGVQDSKTFVRYLLQSDADIQYEYCGDIYDINFIPTGNEVNSRTIWNKELKMTVRKHGNIVTEPLATVNMIIHDYDSIVHFSKMISNVMYYDIIHSHGRTMDNNQCSPFTYGLHKKLYTVYTGIVTMVKPR